MNSELSPQPAIRKTPLFSKVGFQGESTTAVHGQKRTCSDVLIEACAVGKPVIIGPHTYNFAEATQLAVDAGAALRVADARGALATACELLRDPERIRRMAHAGAKFIRRHQGATDRTIELLKF